MKIVVFLYQKNAFVNSRIRDRSWLPCSADSPTFFLKSRCEQNVDCDFKKKGDAKIDFFNLGSIIKQCLVDQNFLGYTLIC